MSTILPMLFLACGGSAPQDPAPSPTDAGEATTIAIVHQSRLDGEIEPCG